MTTPTNLGMGDRELVAIVGAGGKSTLLLSLGRELSMMGRGVVMTTTTKMGADQLPEWATACRTLDEVRRAVGRGKSVFLLEDIDSSKIVGASPAMVDAVFASPGVDYVLAEADGAAGQMLKAPADHEPVIPAATTLVIVVAGLAAVGRRICDVTHRPERVAALLTCDNDKVLEPADIATLVTHPRGGLWRVPDTARVAVVLTGPASEEAEEIRRRLSAAPRIERVVVTDRSK